MLRLGVYSAALYLVCTTGAGAQAVNYEFIDAGSAVGQNNTYTYKSIRLDHVNNEYFICNVLQDNPKGTLSGQCNVVIPGLPSGTNIKTIIVGGTGNDEAQSEQTFWEIDQASGATYFCNGVKQGTNTAWCATLTINP